EGEGICGYRAMNAVSVDFDYLEPKEWQRSWIKGEREGTTSSDLYIAPEIYKDELDGGLDVYLLALFFTRRTTSRTSPAQWPQSARHARSTSSGNQYDRHWDTPISVNVRANVDIVVRLVSQQVLCLWEFSRGWRCEYHGSKSLITDVARLSHVASLMRNYSCGTNEEVDFFSLLNVASHVFFRIDMEIWENAIRMFEGFPALWYKQWELSGCSFAKPPVQQLKESISISVGLQANPDNVTLSVQRLDNNIGEKDKESVDASK
ncbi:hypothetical protein Tco_1247417, partial [Tanacetum coccineum]